MKKGIIAALIIALVLVFGMFYLSGLTGKPKQEQDNKNLTESEAVSCALQLYQEKKAGGINFSSQCLGVCGDFAVDIVHVPRNEEDNKEENQCKEYREGKAKRFIELDKDGNIFRVV